MEYIGPEGVVIYHDTPWNNGVCDGLSLELDSMSYDSDRGTTALLDDFCTRKKADGYKLISFRISGVSIDLKRILLNCRFQVVEHTLNVVTNNLNPEQLYALSDRFSAEVVPSNESHRSDLLDLAYSEFRFGRFFEDPFVLEERARVRNRQWMSDLLDREASVAVLQKKGKAIGFMAYSQSEGKTELILGGVKSNYRHLSYGFWAKVLLSLSQSKEIRTLISSSNTDVLNLYAYLGFRFENPQFGFHRYL